MEQIGDCMKKHGYLLQEFISNGSFCECYKTQKQNKFYAIKIIDKSIFNEDNQLQNHFMNHLTINQQMTTHRIAKIIDQFEDQLYNYLVYPYFENDLFLYVRGINGGQSGLNENDAIDIFIQILLAIEQLHNQGYIHRNLKPDNILINIDKEIMIQISIFTVLMEKKEKTQELVGTQGYMAPELLIKNPDYDKKIDIWSLGCILYFLIFCEELFPAKNLIQYLQNLQSFYKNNNYEFDVKKITKLKQENQLKSENLSKNVQDLFNRLLQYEPQNRINIQDLLVHPCIKDRFNYHQSQEINKEEQKNDSLLSSDIKQSDIQNIQESFTIEQETALLPNSNQIQFFQKIEKQSSINSQKFLALEDLIRQKCIKIIPIQDIEICDQIGSGGFGRVYSGKWNTIKVAIKKLELEYEDFKTIDKEITFMAVNRHPKLVNLYGISIQENLKQNYVEWYIIMELMKFDLQNQIQQGIQKQQKLQILTEIAEGLNFLHSQNIVHRDLKPQNILISENGNIKLTDLGVSKILENKDETYTQSLFTAKYASPEIAIEEKTTFSCDIWSFGLIMYEIMTGYKIWKNLKAAKIIVSLSQKQIPFEVGLNDLDLNHDLKKLIEDCCNYDYKNRPTSQQVYQRMTGLFAQEKNNF